MISPVCAQIKSAKIDTAKSISVNRPGWDGLSWNVIKLGGGLYITPASKKKR